MHSRRRQGQATVEYVLIVAVILAALIAAISGGSFGTAIKNLFGALGTQLTNAVSTVPGAETK